MSNKSEATWHPNTGPEVPHADLIEARVRFTTTPCRTCDGWEQHVYVTRYMTDDGLVTSEVRGLTNANHQHGCALGDTVPREQYASTVDERAAWEYVAHAAERERDEARAERDALAHVIEQVKAAGSVPFVTAEHAGAMLDILDAAPAVSLALHDAEVKAQALDDAARDLWCPESSELLAARAAAVRENVQNAR